MKSSLASLLRFLREIGGWAPVCAPLVVGLMTLAAFFEGVVLALLFPLLGLLGFDAGGNMGGLPKGFERALAAIGVGFNAYTIAAFIVLMFALQHALSLGYAWLLASLQSELTARWRHQLLDALLECEWLYFSQQKLGHLTQIVNFETSRASMLLQHVAQSVSLILTCIVYGAVAFFASWQVSLVLFTGGAMIALMSQLLVRSAGKSARRNTHQTSALVSLVAEALSGMKLVRALDAADAVRQTTSPAIDRLRKTERQIGVQPAVLRASFEVAAVAVLMAMLVSSGAVFHVSAATVLLITTLFMRLYPRIASTQQVIHQARMYLPYYDAVATLLDGARSHVEPRLNGKGAPALAETPPRLSFENVSIAYGDRPALNDVSFEVPARETIAIVGRSGGGKSTLVDSLLRLVPHQKGRIAVDGTDLADIDIGAWRRTVGYVPQDTFLFNASIRDNIAFANSSATTAEIEEAAKKAQLTTFIASLPDGLNTVVGDRGVALSGGQRQRVGLARALLGRKRLLVLDEATSALDSETEQAIMDDIAKLQSEVTIIIVAHRLSTIRNADLIVFLDSGHIAEIGTWQALLAKQGQFHRLWQIQTEQGGDDSAFAESTTGRLQC